MKTIPETNKHHRRHQVTTLALNIGLFAGLTALPLQAQDENNIPTGYTEDEQYDPGDWFDGSNSKHSMKTVSFDGKVDGFKKVNLEDRKGKRDEYTFARIRLQNDKIRVISLGSRMDLSNLDLEKGDHISVSGRNVRIDNRDVLVASSIEVDDKHFRIRKQIPED